jgi:hypothetical protein
MRTVPRADMALTDWRLLRTMGIALGRSLMSPLTAGCAAVGTRGRAKASFGEATIVS